MTLQDIKTQIENNEIKNTFMIFKCDNKFIPRQYYKEISKILGLNLEYLEDLSSISTNSIDIFFADTTKNNTLRVYSTDTFEYQDTSLSDEENLIIITKQVDKETEKLYSNYIIEVDPLEHWCIKDYLYSVVKGVPTKYLDWLMENCNYDINRLQLEIEKLLIFDENERTIIFEQMLNDDAFSDISNKTIFDFTDGIVKKDLNKLITIYEDIDNIDIEAIGVVTVLYKNFLKLLQVWMSLNPTPESTGLSSKQIYAIRKLPRIWSENQLVNILELLTSIDYKIKNGEMPVNILRDYIVVKILSE